MPAWFWVDSQARAYSAFDLVALISMTSLTGLALTSLIPAAYEAVDDATGGTGATGGTTNISLEHLRHSGVLLSVSAVGLSTSTAVSFFCVSERVHDGKLLHACVVLVIALGGALHAALSLTKLPWTALLLPRVLVSVGQAVKYTCKRQISAISDPNRRVVYMNLMNASNLLGMGLGPVSVGVITLAASGAEGHDKSWIRMAPGLVTCAFALFVVPGLCLAPIRGSVLERTCRPLYKLEATKQKIDASEGLLPAAPAQQLTAVTPTLAPAPPAAPPSVVASAIVQVTCQLFGVSRIFLGVPLSSEPAAAALRA